MYGCETQTIKKTERQRIDAFELWYWRRLLRVAWTARRSNQSIQMEINPEYLLEGLMPKLKLQYFGHLIRRIDSLQRPWHWERLKVGWERDNRGWDGLMASLILWTWVWVISRSWWYTGKPDVLLSMGPQRVGHDWITEENWIEGFLGSSDGKESACNGGDLSLIPGSGRSPGEGNGYKLPYSGLENSMDREPDRLSSIGLQRVRHDKAKAKIRMSMSPLDLTIRSCNLIVVHHK